MTPDRGVDDDGLDLAALTKPRGLRQVEPVEARIPEPHEVAALGPGEAAVLGTGARVRLEALAQGGLAERERVADRVVPEPDDVRRRGGLVWQEPDVHRLPSQPSPRMRRKPRRTSAQATSGRSHSHDDIAEQPS